MFAFKILIYTALSFGAFTAQAQQKTYSVSGTVLATDGQVIRKLTVRFLPAFPRGSAEVAESSLMTDIDGEGRFTVTGIKAGHYRIVVDRAGTLLKVADVNKPMPDALAIRIESDIRDLVVHVVKEAAISGRVIDSDGDPVRNFTVTALLSVKLRRKTRYMVVGSAQTDDRGQYRVFGLAEGDYYLRAVNKSAQYSGAPDSEDRYASTFYPSALSPDEASSVALCPGDEAEADIMVQRLSDLHVSGVVPFRIGSEDAIQLSLNSVDAYDTPRAATLNEKNEFIFKQVTPGHYIVNATLFRSSNNPDEAPKTLTAWVPVTVGFASVEGVVVRPTLPATIHGVIRVTNGSKPDFSGLVVFLYPKSDIGSRAARAFVEKDGTFTVEDALPGDYRISVNTTNQEGIARFASHFAQSAKFDGVEAIQTGFHLGAGPDSHTLEIVNNPDGRRISGIVKDDEGKPVNGATVIVVPEGDLQDRDDLRVQSVTGPDGRFQLKGTAPGKYALSAFLRASAIDRIRFTVADIDDPNAILVNTTTNDVQQDLKVTSADALGPKSHPCSN